MPHRSQPNIIITGTPGVGKSSHCELLATETSLKHLIISDIAKQRGCIDGHDDDLDTWIVDEGKLVDALKPDLIAGGQIIDWHACDCFPRPLIDLVVVIRVRNTSALYDRLSARNYSLRKIEENMDAEIFGELMEEAKAAFEGDESGDDENDDVEMEMEESGPVEVVQMYSDELPDLEANVERIVQWVKQWEKLSKELSS